MNILKTIVKYILGPVLIIGLFVSAILLYNVTQEIYTQVTAPHRVASLQGMDQLPAFEESDFESQNDLMEPPILGLYFQDEKGVLRFHCTAFVVSNIYAITAAHCLENARGNLTVDNIYIYNLELVNTGIVGHAASMNSRGDFGAILGDFHNFRKLRVSNAYGFGGHKGPFGACGFPWGSLPLVCQSFEPAAPYYDKVMGHGFLTPGMSGGPVIDLETSDVVGVNVEVHEGFVAISPVIGIWGALRIERKP